MQLLKLSYFVNLIKLIIQTGVNLENEQVNQMQNGDVFGLWNVECG